MPIKGRRRSADLFPRIHGPQAPGEKLAKPKREPDYAAKAQSGSAMTEILDSLIDAAITGKRRLIKDRLSGRRVPIISTEGLRNLLPDLWPEALRLLAALDAVHFEAKIDFMMAWKRMQFDAVGMSGVDTDLYVAALRKMLPCSLKPGEIVRLYRGQHKAQDFGMSWTYRREVAGHFALYGTEDPDEVDASPHGVILIADVPASAIISDVWTFHVGPGGEGEYIIDPRNIEYTSEPASEAEWIEHERKTAELRKAVRRAKRNKR